MARETSGSCGLPPEERGTAPPRRDGRSGCAADVNPEDVDPEDVDSDLVDLTGVDLDLVAGLDDCVFSRSLNLVLRNVDRVDTAVARYRPG